MGLNHTRRYKEGFMPVVEAADGYLIGGRMIYNGPVFEQFSDALYVMNGWINDNIAAHRAVKIGKVVSFKGDGGLSGVNHQITEPSLAPT